MNFWGLFWRWTRAVTHFGNDSVQLVCYLEGICGEISANIW